MNGTALPLSAAADELRRAQARGLALLGFGPAEQPYRVVASGALWKLRRYAGHEGVPDSGPTILILPAPIKRPYIWDLAPSASVVCRCLAEGLRVFLLEWKSPSQRTATCGLPDLADDAVVEALAALSEETGDTRPILIGHSLGGTFAAIFAALYPERLAGLVLLSAPLCLSAGISPFRDALAAMPLAWLPASGVLPGSLLSEISAMASPATFVWSRFWDMAASGLDARAAQIRPRVEHWALDEMPLSARLVHDIFQLLYCENRLCNGTLTIHERQARPSALRLPTLAVANVADEVAPPASAARFLDAMPDVEKRLIELPGETGVVLQHLSVLLGREALARTWPEIVAWIRAHG